MPLETELKLAIDAADAGRLSEVPVVREHLSGVPSTVRVLNIYFDTADLLLRDRGIGLRLRNMDGRWLQTVKRGNAPAAGLQRRQEWEHEVYGKALDFTRFEDPELRVLLDDPGVRVRLEPRFTTDFERTIRDLRFTDGMLIEMAVDIGTIRAGDRTRPIAEVELELKQGRPERIFEIAHALTDALPVRILHQSKAERGYALVRAPRPPAGSKAGELGLRADMSAEAAMQAILRHTLDHLLRNESVVLENPADIEGVHQMRVATRRLRSCLRVFRSVLSRPVTSLLNRRVKWLTDALGPARDWDVLIDETLAPMREAFSDHAGLLEIGQAAEGFRARAYDRAREALESTRYTDLVLTMAGWIEGRKWRATVEARQRKRLEGPAKRFAVKLLDGRYARVCERGDRFESLSVEERHALRIRCKRLRYAAEFFADLWGRERTRPLIRHLSGLQDILGVLNDAAVSRGLLAEITADEDHPGVALVLGWKAAMTHVLLARFGRSWKAFTGCERFWKS